VLWFHTIVMIRTCTHLPSIAVSLHKGDAVQSNSKLFQYEIGDTLLCGFGEATVMEMMTVGVGKYSSRALPKSYFSITSFYS